MISSIRDFYNKNLSTRYPYPAPYDKLRADVTLWVCYLTVIFNATGLLHIISEDQPTVTFGPLIIPFVVSFIGAILLIILVNMGYLQIVIWSVWLGIGIISGYMSLLTGPSTMSILLATLTVLYATLHFRWWGAVLTILLWGITMIYTQQYVPSPANVLILNQGWFTLLQYLSIFIALVGMISIMLQWVLDTISTNRYLQMQIRAINAATSVLDTATNITDIATKAVNYIRDQFALYQVQMFILDPQGHYAELIASTSDTGTTLAPTDLKISVNSNSYIAQVIAAGKPVLNRRTENSNTLSPQTTEMYQEAQSELALPIISTDSVIGVLHLLSKRNDTFTSVMLIALETMVSQIAITLRHSQKMTDQQRTLSETRRLYLEAETNLRQAETLNQQLTLQAWRDLLRAHTNNTIGYTFSDDKLIEDTTWSEVSLSALTRRRPIIQPRVNNQVIAVPIELRGNVLGAVEIEVGRNVRQAELLNMLNTVAQRLAIGIDNMRLFEQAQDLADYQYQVNEVATKLLQQTDFEQLIYTVLSEVSAILKAEQASIRLGTTPAKQEAK